MVKIIAPMTIAKVVTEVNKKILIPLANQDKDLSICWLWHN